MHPKDTPPTGTPIPRPPRALPTLATVQASIDLQARELRGARLDIDALKTEVKAIRLQLEETADNIRISFIPKAPALPTPMPASAPTSTPVPAPRPSLAAKGAKGAGKVGKWIFFGLGVAATVAQVLAEHTAYRGPLLELLRVLGSLGGGQ